MSAATASQNCPRCQQQVGPADLDCPHCGHDLGADPDPLIGVTVGNLVLVEKLGEGGMGAVYRAEHRALRTPYAVKVLHPQFSKSAATTERFRREALACSRLRHENVVFVTDFGIQDDLGLYIVMEFLEADPLSRVRQRGRLTIGRIGRLGTQICDAMAAAHRLGIIHRDLKPDNIMVLRDPARPDFVKVLDFGIAHVHGAEAGPEQLTKAGITMGTPAYIAPEQIIGKRGAVGPAADIYSLGVIFFELLAGATPFPQTGTDYQILSHHVHTPAPPISQRFPALSGTHLEALIAAMLEKQPERRPASMIEVRDRLGEAIQQLRERSTGTSAGATRPAGTSAEPTLPPMPVPPMGVPAPVSRPAIVAVPTPAPVSRPAIVVEPAETPAQKLQRAHDEHREKAMGLSQAGQYAEAADEYAAAYWIKADPALHYQMAWCYRMLGQHDKALSAFERFRDESPQLKNDARARLEQLIIEEREKLGPQGTAAPAAPSASPREVRPEATAPPEPEPGSYAYHHERAVGHVRARQYGDAIREFEAAYQLRPNPAILFNLATAYRSLGRPRQAMEYLDRFEQAQPDISEVVRLKLVGLKAELRRLIDALDHP